MYAVRHGLHTTCIVEIALLAEGVSAISCEASIISDFNILYGPGDAISVAKNSLVADWREGVDAWVVPC